MDIPHIEALVFLSYAREDSSFALRLATDLKSMGVNVWVDQLDIRPGDVWASEVEQALDRCGELVVVLSSIATRSRNVMDEIAYALEEGKTVIPLIQSDCRIPFRLGRLQHVDFRPDYSTALQILFSALTPGLAHHPATQSTGKGPPATMEDKAELKTVDKEGTYSSEPNTEEPWGASGATNSGAKNSMDAPESPSKTNEEKLNCSNRITSIIDNPQAIASPLPPWRVNPLSKTKRQRIFQVILTASDHTIEYEWKLIGPSSVRVDGRLTYFKRGYLPLNCKFELMDGGVTRRGQILATRKGMDVIKTIRLTVDGLLLYSES